MPSNFHSKNFGEIVLSKFICGTIKDITRIFISLQMLNFIANGVVPVISYPEA